MKTVRNATELKRFVMSRGATATVDGSTINASGSRMRLVAPQAPPPEPPPAPLPTQPAEDKMSSAMIRVGELLAAAIAMKGEPPVAAAPMVAEAPPPMPRIMGWDIEVVKGPHDLMKMVVATSDRGDVIQFDVERDEGFNVTRMRGSRLD